MLTIQRWTRRAGVCEVRRVLRCIALAAFFGSTVWAAQAETGSAGWLRYSRITNPAALQQDRLLPRQIVQADTSPVGRSASSELEQGLGNMLGGEFNVDSALPDADAFVLGTPKELHRLLPRWRQPSRLAEEGFAISKFNEHGHHLWIIAGGSERGELYGVFHLLEQVAELHEIAPDAESPSAPIRWVNQWDNFDGSVERGYAGRSIFFDGGHVRGDLTRVSEYGRLLASVGLNGCTVNNVNSDLRTLQPEMLHELARIDLRSA
jgi:alpha-glucuronidase